MRSRIKVSMEKGRSTRAMAVILNGISVVSFRNKIAIFKISTKTGVRTFFQSLVRGLRVNIREIRVRARQVFSPHDKFSSSRKRSSCTDGVARNARPLVTGSKLEIAVAPARSCYRCCCCHINNNLPGTWRPNANPWSLTIIKVDLAVTPYETPTRTNEYTSPYMYLI